MVKKEKTPLQKFLTIDLFCLEWQYEGGNVNKLSKIFMVSREAVLDRYAKIRFNKNEKKQLPLCDPIEIAPIVNNKTAVVNPKTDYVGLRNMLGKMGGPDKGRLLMVKEKLRREREKRKLVDYNEIRQRVKEIQDKKMGVKNDSV